MNSSHIFLVVRTLTGHKSNIRSVEFHPFGDFFASGSLDLTVKIWDIRRKGCIQTYHGHHDAISLLKITPDGRWLASGGYDHTVKIWDMTAGKLIQSIEHHSPIHSISFHPTEFLMTTSCEQGILRVFDLQTFECTLASKPIEHVVLSDYSVDGQQLYCATKSAFKVCFLFLIHVIFIGF
jgi:katanin p80 WD40 repeat-containing subunit B1